MTSGPKDKGACVALKDDAKLVQLGLGWQPSLANQS